MTDTLPVVTLPVTVRYRYDFYWQTTALYAITLIVYIVVRALWERTLQVGLVNVVVTDPVVVLLGTFVVGSTIALVVNTIARRSVTVSDDGLTFASRFHTRTFTRDEIERVSIGRDRRIKVRGVFSVVKIHIHGRRRPLRIRPALYDREHVLVAALLGLRHPHRGAVS